MWRIQYILPRTGRQPTCSIEHTFRSTSSSTPTSWPSNDIRCLWCPRCRRCPTAQPPRCGGSPAGWSPVGSSGRYDEWLTERHTPALAGATRRHFARVSARLVPAADTRLLRTDAPPSLQLGLHRRADGYTLVLVNTDTRAAGPFSIHLQLMPYERITTCRLSALRRPVYRSLIPRHRERACRPSGCAGWSRCGSLPNPNY